MSALLVRRWQCIAVLIVLLLPPLVRANLASIENVRVRTSPERTRIVFDLSQPLEHRVFSLTGPDRLVIDVFDTRLDTDFDALALSSSPIRKMRASVRDKDNIRIVLDLADSVKPRSFVLKPILQYGDRLVIDLYTEDQQTPVVRKADRIARQMRDIVIAIDAGHGGDDPGAIGHGRLYEKDVVMAISSKLAGLFEKEPGYKPLMIRQGDYYLGLRERTAIARKGRADIFLSIHADAFKTAEARGASVYAISEKGATSETARWLAEKENRADLIGGAGEVSLDDKDDLLAGVLLDLSITASLMTSLELGSSVLRSIKPVNRLHKKQVEQAGFAVLKSPDIPSLLIETGYISNPQEANRLKTRSHQNKMANAIFVGIKSYISSNPPAGSYLAWKRQGYDRRLDTYRIVSGDTLSGIANKHRVSAEMLKKVNDLQGDLIRIGQVLKIPSS
jgi:N-acetylmuramoyl-L-alanine amidase